MCIYLLFSLVFDYARTICFFLVWIAIQFICSSYSSYILNPVYRLMKADAVIKNISSDESSNEKFSCYIVTDFSGVLRFWFRDHMPTLAFHLLLSQRPRQQKHGLAFSQSQWPSSFNAQLSRQVTHWTMTLESWQFLSIHQNWYFTIYATVIPLLNVQYIPSPRGITSHATLCCPKSHSICSNQWSLTTVYATHFR